ncbi:MAG: hypothetical protein ACRDQX_10770, partial [Pseudonocardiaceae bacterium]
LLAAILMATAILVRKRWISIAAHTITVTLIAVWLLAFIIRWLTDAATTIINPLNWSVLLFLAVWSAMRIDEPLL